MPPQRKFVPMNKKFRFECQMCGLCCRNNLILITGEEIVRLKEHNFPIYFKKADNIQPDDPKTKHLVTLLPCMASVVEDGARQCFFLGDGKNPNICSIYGKRLGSELRPGACRIFPFVAHTPTNKPSPDEVRKTITEPTLTDEEAMEFVHPYHVSGVGGKTVTLYAIVVCHTTTPSGMCPGVGKGPEWSDAEREKTISVVIRESLENLHAVENTIEQYVIMFMPEFDKHFEPVEEEPLKREGYHRAKKRSWEDILGA